MVRLALCDDEQKIVFGLKNMIAARYGDAFSIVSANDPEQLMEDWEKFPHKSADILITDIQFITKDKWKSGIDFAEKIQEKFPKTKVIFITAHLEYATEIFEASPVYFLLKPIEKTELFKAIDKSMEQMQKEWESSIYVENKKSVEKISVNEIVYIENKGKSLIVHLKGEDKYLRLKISEMEEKLPDCFLRPHQSYLVNMDYISLLNRNEIILQNNINIPVSRMKYAMVKEKLLLYWGHQ